MTDHPWLRDFLRTLGTPAKLDRAAFVALYFPQYVEAYRPDYRIRLRSDGRPTRTTPGNVKAQQTKRDKRIDEAFARYARDYEASYSLTEGKTL